MGTNVMQCVIAKDADQKAFLAELNDFVEHEDWEEGGCYPADKLHWHYETVYDTRADAERAIHDMETTWHLDHAVLFHDTDAVETKPTKQCETLEQRIATLKKQRDEYVSKNHADCRTSAYIGCPKCGSKIRREFLKGRDACPVCGGELRSDTVMKRITSYDARIADAKKQLAKLDRERSKRVSKKAPVKWLVQWSYHS